MRKKIYLIRKCLISSKLMFKILALMLLRFSPIFAQESTKYLEDKSSAYIAVLNSHAIGSYHDLLKSGGSITSNWGILGGFLWNPYGRKKPSPIFYGFELAYQSEGRENVKATVNGDFVAKFNNYWLNGVARYRPILGNTRINPFVDAFFGGKLMVTDVRNILTVDESESLQTDAKFALNYGIGVGTGIRLFGDLKNTYLDIGLYYQQAEPAKIIKRNTIVVNNNFTVDYQKILSNTNQLIIKIGLTGFL